jgi:hypothetical protein
MANWILLARDASGKPIVFAMNGPAKEENFSGGSKKDLIVFLNPFRTL